MNAWEEEDLDQSMQAGLAAGGIIAAADLVMGFMSSPIHFASAVAAAGLTYGVFRRSRACAIALLVVYLAVDLYPLSKLLGRFMNVTETFDLKIWVLPFILGGSLFGGIFGTFTVHAAKKAPLPEDPTWIYEDISMGGTTMKLRTHRQTGAREALHPVQGWVAMKPKESPGA